MKKAITTLLAALIIMAVIDMAVAAVAASTTYATDQQQTKITVTDYPKQVKVGEDFHIKGQLTSGGNGLGNKLIYFDTLNTTENQWYWYYNFTTKADGSFDDFGHWSKPNTYQCRYAFWGDGQFAASVSDPFVITVS